MQLIPTSLPGVILVEPRVFRDERGFFLESYHRERMAAAGIGDEFVQDNHSKSVQGTLRGLHFQRTFQQSKLCRVVQGAVFDVAVDIRPDSAHFGEWFGTVLSAENQRQIYVPRGFAHGFLVLSETAEFLYKCSDFYHPEDEGGVAWNDPQIGIAWPLKEWNIQAPILSAKDHKNPQLNAIPREQLPQS
jgi:dTDP-4-dehydrorhamnose 3,5-epimerase